MAGDYPEDKDVLESVNVVGGEMYVLRLKDVKSEVTIYSLEGKGLEGDYVIAVPWMCAVGTRRGRWIRMGSIRFSRHSPPTIFPSSE